ncbi:MAG: hypothetical protein EBZ26_08125, partial [Flavobacteriia bacterium]|nr:hypothetical protein [Flavobacteriia bacterium]
MRMKRSLFFVLVFAAFGLSAQVFKCGSLTVDSRENLKRDMEFLASDDLEGRLPGTEGANQTVA